MKLEKILKQLSSDVREEMDGMSEAQLEKVIVQSEEALEKATRERDSNPGYKSAKQAVSDLSAGLKDVRKYQGAKKGYALHRLKEIKGEE
jgi:hypothetical protein